MRYLYFIAFLLLVAIGAAPFVRRQWSWMSWERLAGLTRAEPHAGATETWSPLASAGDTDHIGQELLANLKTSAMAEVEAHEKVAQTIDSLCDDLMAELAAICDKVLTAAKTCDRRHTRELRLDSRGRAWLAAGLPGDTGGFDRRELEALLAVTS